MSLDPHKEQARGHYWRSHHKLECINPRAGMRASVKLCSISRPKWV
ncbi:hypothetical protein AVDCRST_MAG84-7651 [uncultured Microcoleus sp.]|uniref:Uncharacterized protein n=1 Tax=uncultured Microcoleus sp. TaxID=259945 RepID=A0A6J4Q318_9CYAN|nr:hypothetical protein AVDCRST_MAG84-7651 [uncultured Microcoleus sp.]